MKQFLIVVGILLACATPGFSCSCAHPSPDLTTRLARAEARIKQAPVIFEGRVEKIGLQGWPLKPEPGKTVFMAPGSYGIKVTFSGTHLYRGEPKGDLVIATGLGMGDCGYPFEPGQSYLVYAWFEDSGTLSTGICTGTTPLEYAETALRLLRGDPPTPGDLADLGNEDATPSSSTEEGIKLCGKVSFPPGSKARSLKIVLWHADRDASPLPHNVVDSQDDGSFCFDDVDSGAYVLEAVEASSDKAKYRYGGFYPGVKDRAQAKTLLVDQSHGDVRPDFTVSRISVVRIKGYLRGVPESDNDQVMVMITSHGDPILTNEPVHLGPHGAFEIPGVPGGRYSVFAVRFDEQEEADESITFVSEVLDLDVQADVSGLKLQFVPKQ